MKFFAIVATIFLATTSTYQAPVVDCGQGKVTLASKSVCIQPEYIEGCESYSSENQCAGCNGSYKLNNNKKCDFVGTITNYQAMPGCLAFDANGKCTNCANGFKKKDGLCLKGHKNCQTYDESNNCTDCRNDYSLVLGHCRHNLLLGCRNEQSDHTCKDCFAPFKMNGNHCDIAHCKTYNDYGCVGCECGYYLTAEKACKQVTSGCVRYQRGICTNCLPHYKLKGGSCQIDGCSQYEGNRCTKCAQNYELTSEGGCSFKNCYDWLDGKCLVCQKGFKKQSDGCVKVNESELQCM